MTRNWKLPMLLLKAIAITVEKRVIKRKIVVHSQKKDQRKRRIHTGVIFATQQDTQPTIAPKTTTTKEKVEKEKEKVEKAKKEKVEAKAEKEKRTKVEEGKEKASSQPTISQKTGACTTTQKKTRVQRKKNGI